jgi:serine/threonine protein kinase
LTPRRCCRPRQSGTVKIIDFGSTKVKGVVETATAINHDDILGTVQYAAPEYFVGESGTSRADIFSLGVIAYQILTGRLPYGAELARARTRSQQRKLRYYTALDDNRAIPAWIDEVLKKAVHLDPYKRYEEVSEFTYALRHPNQELSPLPRPLLERNPLLFWQCSTLMLVVVVLLLLFSKVG